MAETQTQNTLNTKAAASPGTAIPKLDQAGTDVAATSTREAETLALKNNVSAESARIARQTAPDDRPILPNTTPEQTTAGEKLDAARRTHHEFESQKFAANAHQIEASLTRDAKPGVVENTLRQRQTALEEARTTVQAPVVTKANTVDGPTGGSIDEILAMPRKPPPGGPVAATATNTTPAVDAVATATKSEIKLAANTPVVDKVATSIVTASRSREMGSRPAEAKGARSFLGALGVLGEIRIPAVKDAAFSDVAVPKTVVPAGAKPATTADLNALSAPPLAIGYSKVEAMDNLSQAKPVAEAVPVAPRQAPKPQYGFSVSSAGMH
jgi:hypothetical protein